MLVKRMGEYYLLIQQPKPHLPARGLFGGGKQTSSLFPPPTYWVGGHNTDDVTIQIRYYIKPRTTPFYLFIKSRRQFFFLPFDFRLSVLLP